MGNSFTLEHPIFGQIAKYHRPQSSVIFGGTKAPTKTAKGCFIHLRHKRFKKMMNLLWKKFLTYLSQLYQPTMEFLRFQWKPLEWYTNKNHVQTSNEALEKLLNKHGRLSETNRCIFTEPPKFGSTTAAIETATSPDEHPVANSSDLRAIKQWKNS